MQHSKHRTLLTVSKNGKFINWRNIKLRYDLCELCNARVYQQQYPGDDVDKKRMHPFFIDLIHMNYLSLEEEEKIDV